MKRVLFVDDEPNVLEGLRGLLRRQRKVWEMTFVGGGEQALRELSSSPHDVIVTDMRMPGVDGAALLRKVQQDHPQVVRIVLSGQTEQEVARRMVHIAHQFISKPFDGHELQQVIESTFKVQALVEHPGLRSSLGQVGQLPVRPGLYARLVQILESPQVTLADAAVVIEQDTGISAKLLQVVNSAFFGLRQRVVDVRTAAASLGLDIVKALALSAEVRASQAEILPCEGYSVDAAERHSLLAARIARRLLRDRSASQAAFSAAKLKETGALVLMSRLPDEFRRIVQATRATGRPVWEAEVEVLGVTHAEIGAYLLGIWGLPGTIVDSVAFQHAPQRSSPTGLDAVCAVHIASALAEEVEPPNRAEHIGAGATLDATLLDRLGLAPELPAWREIARQEAQRAHG